MCPHAGTFAPLAANQGARKSRPRLSGAPEVDGTFGDGVVVLHYLDQPASLQARSVRVEGNARAGFASFEGLVHMTDCRFECNTIDLNGESVTIDFSFEDGGGNTCGCDGESLPCKVLSSGLQPPAAI